eukprot:12278932-Alexandrium_andersonii.AAC.1
MADNGGSHSAQVAPAARQEAGAPARARKTRERRGRQLKAPRARTSRGGLQAAGCRGRTTISSPSRRRPHWKKRAKGKPTRGS